MAEPARLFTGQRNSLDIPSETVARFLPRAQPLRGLEYFDRGRLQQLAAVYSHTEAHQVGRGGEKYARACVAGVVDRAHRVGAVTRVSRKTREVGSRPVADRF